MHLSRILDQIKRHPSPTEALTKLGKAMDKHEDNLLEKGFRILKSELCANVYEAINGPHFDEEHARYAGFNTLMSDNASKFNILGSKIDAQTQIINDKFCQLEMREMQNKIDALRDEKNALQTSAITQQQTQNIVNQIKPCPVPAYLTCNPYGCNGGFTGYGYGYGYGDSCCA